MKAANASTLRSHCQAPPGGPRRGAPGPCGLSLIELLITLAIISILAAVLIPQMGQQIPDQLTAVSEVIASDLEYARSLAVTNNSTYEIAFALSQKRYVLRHSGPNTLLHVLPSSPFRSASDPPDRQTTDLADLPMAQPTVHLLAVVTDNGTLAVVSDIEFTSLGSTTRTSPTTIWLTCGAGLQQRYVPLVIHPATGLVEIGSLRKDLPANVAAIVGL